MLDWLRKLFKYSSSPQLTKEEIRDVEISQKEIDSGKAQTFHNTDDFLKDLHDFRQEAIARKNLERQKNTLGYGLKSRNFKPRPAFEKRQWKLDKKPTLDED